MCVCVFPLDNCQKQRNLEIEEARSYIRLSNTPFAISFDT